MFEQRVSDAIRSNALVALRSFSTVTKFRCVRHEIVYVSRNSGPHQPMGRGLTPALRRSRGIGAEIAISQHDHCSRRPPLRVGSPPEASTAVCMHTTDVTVIATTDNCHRYRHHRNKAALQVCVLAGRAISEGPDCSPALRLIRCECEW